MKEARQLWKYELVVCIISLIFAAVILLMRPDNMKTVTVFWAACTIVLLIVDDVCRHKLGDVSADPITGKTLLLRFVLIGGFLAINHVGKHFGVSPSIILPIGIAWVAIPCIIQLAIKLSRA